MWQADFRRDGMIAELSGRNGEKRRAGEGGVEGHSVESVDAARRSSAECLRGPSRSASLMTT